MLAHFRKSVTSRLGPRVPTQTERCLSCRKSFRPCAGQGHQVGNQCNFIGFLPSPSRAGNGWADFPPPVRYGGARINTNTPMQNPFHRSLQPNHQGPKGPPGPYAERAMADAESATSIRWRIRPVNRLREPVLRALFVQGGRAVSAYGITMAQPGRPFRRPPICRLGDEVIARPKRLNIINPRRGPGRQIPAYDPGPSR